MMQPVRKAFGQKMRDVEDRLSSGRGDVSVKIGDELQEYENGDDLYAYGKEVEATILPREITRLMSRMEEDLRRSLREVVEEQSALYFDDLDQKLEDAGMEAFHFEPSELKLDGVEGARRMQADKEEIEKIEDEVEQLVQEKTICARICWPRGRKRTKSLKRRSLSADFAGASMISRNPM